MHGLALTAMKSLHGGQKGAVLIDIPAERFAERAEVAGKLIWDDVTEGAVSLATARIDRLSDVRGISHFPHANNCSQRGKDV